MAVLNVAQSAVYNHKHKESVKLCVIVHHSAWKSVLSGDAAAPPPGTSGPPMLKGTRKVSHAVSESWCHIFCTRKKTKKKTNFMTEVTNRTSGWKHFCAPFRTFLMSKRRFWPLRALLPIGVKRHLALTSLSSETRCELRVSGSFFFTPTPTPRCRLAGCGRPGWRNRVCAPRSGGARSLLAHSPVSLLSP